MSSTPRVVLSVAGYDPSSGAGVTADVKTAAAHGCFAITCITALTVQSTAGVRRVEAVTGALLSATLAELAADFDIAAVRIGMLGSGEVAEALADFLESHRLPNVVLDPVLKSSSGADLLDPAGTQVLRRRLLALADVVTPNVDEAAALAGLPVHDLDGMRAAAQAIQSQGARAVVVTGGHLPEALDLLCYGEMERLYSGRKIESSASHGTGCAFATALACQLALGTGLTEAVAAAKQYVACAIEAGYPLGRGKGPLNHLYRWK